MRSKKNSWTCLLLIMAGLVIGGLIGTFFPDNSFLNYGQSFGLVSPLVLDLKIISITFAMQIHITVASIIGIVLGVLVYRFI